MGDDRSPARDRPHVSFRSLMLGTGPRFARDAVGPVLAFYVAWKVAGLGPGIVLGTSVALAAFFWERRRSRSGLGAAIGLGIALTQALVGALSGSAIGYFAPGVIANAANRDDRHDRLSSSKWCASAQPLRGWGVLLARRSLDLSRVYTAPGPGTRCAAPCRRRGTAGLARSIDEETLDAWIST